MFKFFTKITGDDYNMLINDTPASRKKVVLLANALFIPVLLWFFSAFSMATSLFGASVLGGLCSGIIAGAFIYVIDRSILMAHGGKSIVVFRFIIGICIASLGSIMIDECIFKEDIDQRLEANKEAGIQQLKDGIQQRNQNNLAIADNNISQTYASWMQSQVDVKNEADGHGGTGQSGVGSITVLKTGISAKQEAEYNNALSYRDSLLKEQKSALQIAEDKINASFGKAMLLHRIEALFDLVGSNGIVMFIYSIFTIFICCLEFIVILFKMNSAETNYEKKIRMIELMGSNRIDKIAGRDKEWFEGGNAHTSTKELRNSIGKTPPAFYN